MALDVATAQEMLKKLAEDQATYINTLTRTQDLLAQALTAAATAKPPARLTTERVRRSTDNNALIQLDVESVKKNSKGSTISIDDDSDTDDDESLFVQQVLPSASFDQDGLKRHLKNHAWTDAGKSILFDVESKLQRHILFPVELGPVPDRSHLSHYSIFDGKSLHFIALDALLIDAIVGQDGAPLEIPSGSRRPMSRSMDIWERIRNLNNHPSRERKAVGRIIIVREPSPLLFGALHYIMKEHFDMDEMFHLLVKGDKTKALAHRPFSADHRHRRTFVFTLEYFTIVGDECKPMVWQAADEELGESEIHVPVSRCTSVIGLCLQGDPASKIRNRNRRVVKKDVKQTGDVFDPFSPWYVLSMQAYPDWKSTVHSHDSTKHYVNGPEAFLVTLRAEFKDAQKRLMEVYRRISDLVRTPPDFMFRGAVRDRLLFEDDEFTYSRRYFWAQQSLGIMNEDISEMIAAYKQTFTEDVWEGSDKIIWPGDETTSSRYAHWRKRMRILRKDIEEEIHGLEMIDQLNDEKIKEIRNLRDNLFSGTSVLESRRSVQQQAITVQQGHNIKLLTLVTIFFLPLTFVTSVFGMTNMDPRQSFKPFGIVTTVICVPTYMLILSLNTTRGLQFWRAETHALRRRAKHVLGVTFAFFGYRTGWIQDQQLRRKTQILPASDPRSPIKVRSQSASEGIAARGGYGPEIPTPPVSPLASTRHVQFGSSRSLELTKSPLDANVPELPSPYASKPQSKTEAEANWISRLFRRRGTASMIDKGKDLC